MGIAILYFIRVKFEGKKTSWPAFLTTEKYQVTSLLMIEISHGLPWPWSNFFII